MTVELVQVQATAPEATPWLLIGLILFGSAIVSWGLTEALKATILNRWKFVQHIDTDEAKRRMWWSPLLLVLSMALGCGVGAFVGRLEWSTLYGGLVGAMGGALASFLVSLFKGHLAAWINRLLGIKADEPTKDG